METSVMMFGKSVLLHLDKGASNALETRTTPLFVEMELLFSCLIAKRIHFKTPKQGGIYIPVNRLLHLGFKANIASSCSIKQDVEIIHHQISPIKNLKPYVPRWCKLHYDAAGWSGQFGYDQYKFRERS